MFQICFWVLVRAKAKNGSPVHLTVTATGSCGHYACSHVSVASTGRHTGRVVQASCFLSFRPGYFKSGQVKKWHSCSWIHLSFFFFFFKHHYYECYILSQVTHPGTVTHTEWGFLGLWRNRLLQLLGMFLFVPHVHTWTRQKVGPPPYISREMGLSVARSLCLKLWTSLCHLPDELC